MNTTYGKRKIDEDSVEKRIKRAISIGGVVFVLLLILFTSVYTVKAGHTGVLTTWGKVDMQYRSEGLHFKIPIAQRVTKMSVQTLKYEAGASAASEDLQIVTTNIAVNYRLKAEETPTIYQEIGTNYQSRIIEPAVQEVVKATTAKFTAEELITKRSEVTEGIKLALRERLAPRGIIVEEISITNFEFSDTFNEAIENKVTAEQLKLKADMDLQRIQVEAQQDIEKAKAQAEGLRVQKAQITPELIRLREVENQLKAIERWNGVLPTITGGGAIPFIQMSMEDE